MSATPEKKRFQSKAGSGMARLPSTLDELEKDAESYLGGERKLLDICQEGP